MKTPIIIPAYNAAPYIERTLQALPDCIDPIVAINGATETDRTADIASQFGAQVIEIPEQGKLPAIQKTLQSLGDRALEPLIILDADTYPVFPRRWHQGMVNLLTQDQNRRPAAVGGPVWWFHEGPIASTALRSAAHQVRRLHERTDQQTRTAGPNMGLYLQQSDILDEIIVLPHYWPGEDRAMIDVVRSYGGSYHQPATPSLFTLSRVSESRMSLMQRVRTRSETRDKHAYIDYTARGAAGSIPYPGSQSTITHRSAD